MQSETNHRCLPHFIKCEISTLSPNARTLWLFVYAICLETNCHAFEPGVRQSLSWLAPTDFDTSYVELRTRGLIVRTDDDGELLLEAIDPSLMGENEPWK